MTILVYQIVVHILAAPTLAVICLWIWARLTGEVTYRFTWGFSDDKDLQ